MNDNGFSNACPSGNHMLNDIEYPIFCDLEDEEEVEYEDEDETSE